MKKRKEKNAAEGVECFHMQKLPRNALCKDAVLFFPTNNVYYLALAS